MLVTIQNRMARIFNLNLPREGSEADRPVGKAIKILSGGFAKDVPQDLLEKAIESSYALQSLFDEKKLVIVGGRAEQIEEEDLIQASSSPVMPDDLLDKADASSADGKVKHEKRVEKVEIEVPSTGGSKPSGGRKK